LLVGARAKGKKTPGTRGKIAETEKIFLELLESVQQSETEGEVANKLHKTTPLKPS